MGKRARRRGGDVGDSGTPELSLPPSLYTDADGGTLELRVVLGPKARAEYAATFTGGRNQDDAWQRATELLFERLAVAWTVSGIRTVKQRELLGRYRMASAAERRFVRESLRAHLAEHFPEMRAP